MAWVEQSGRCSWRVRYRRAGGGVGSVPGFASRRAAVGYAGDMESDRRRKVWVDPADGRVLFEAWVRRWLPVQDLDPRTVDNYDSYLRCHLLARFGSTPIGAITALQVDAWKTAAADAGYAAASVSSWANLLSMILVDAVDERLIAVNPVRQRRRRGRRCRTLVRERVWATPEQVLRIADQAAALGGEVARLLVITAAWTGCRWGELAALHRDNLDLDTGHLVVDAERGSLHESRGRRWLGPPKTPSSARRIALPPFLVRLLRRHLESHPFEFVFTTSRGTWLWRSTFDRRVLRPAIDGCHRPGIRAYAVCPGLTFHGLRHSHKTWLIAGGAPEIAQARRLGHHLPDRAVETYSHVAREVETRLLADLQRRWRKAVRSPRPALRAQQKRAAAKSRPPIPPSRKPRQRPNPPALIPDGKRDNSRLARQGRGNGAARKRVPWSSTPQKLPTWDTPQQLDPITLDRPANTRKPLRPATTA